jgi:hypothetical protein
VTVLATSFSGIFQMIQFADSVGLIQVFNQVVRIDLLKAGQPVRNQEAGQQSNTPLLEPSGQLLMPIEGFLQAFVAMEQTLHKLAEAGLIKRNAPQGGPPAEQVKVASASAGGKKKRG